ncbi:hypothetical protein SAMN06265368_1703 [Cohaesibacter gelatinilyticus]|uniref:Uncharacterized protein n=1 Tax=Cohaesibacter gelatinilyticus TaxID=372072 RepID=A0A285NKU3_9HYPH|nr:hypothetical protein SAMN06265368_1703 [Cohaesibacter gelatinilyticus]
MPFNRPELLPELQSILVKQGRVWCCDEEMVGQQKRCFTLIYRCANQHSTDELTNRSDCCDFAGGKFG